jgi:hypothetical protein
MARSMDYELKLRLTEDATSVLGLKARSTVSLPTLKEGLQGEKS